MLSILSCVCWQSVYLLWRNVYLDLLPIFGLGCLFFDIELHELLYILEIHPLSVASLANIFSHSEGCLFVLFMVSSAVQKLLSFIRSYLFIFVFISTTLGGIFHRTRTKNFTICMETQKTLNSQSNLKKENQSWRNQAP